MSKEYEKYELHPRKKLLEALADLIPESGGWVLICDDNRIMSFDLTAAWDYGDAEAIIDLANTKTDLEELRKQRDSVQRDIRSKTQKVAQLEKTHRELTKLLKNPSETHQLNKKGME